MAKKKRICPLMSRVIYWYPSGSVEDQGPELFEVDCKRGGSANEQGCELWIDMVYSTEVLRQEGRCSLRFMGEKNAEGRLPV